MVREEVQAGRDPTWYGWVMGVVFLVAGWLLSVAWSSYGPVRGEKKKKKDGEEIGEVEEGKGWWQPVKVWFNSFEQNVIRES
jgi:hypothetical protein